MWDVFDQYAEVQYDQFAVGPARAAVVNGIKNDFLDLPLAIGTNLLSLFRSCEVQGL